MKSNQKGITLSALVITIIVLLILSGITIAALSGDNGILKRAAQAKYMQQIGETKDLISMKVYEAATEFYNEKYVNGEASENTIGAAIKDALTTAAGDGSFPSATVTVTETEITIAPKADSTKTTKATFDGTTTGSISDWSEPGT